VAALLCSSQIHKHVTEMPMVRQVAQPAGD